MHPVYHHNIYIYHILIYIPLLSFFAASKINRNVGHLETGGNHNLYHAPKTFRSFWWLL